MRKRGRPPSKEPPPAPPEGGFLWAARELARNPDSPTALRIMSSLNAVAGQRLEAVKRIVEALARELEHPTAKAGADVNAALRHWERVTEAVVTEGLLTRWRNEAAELVRARRTGPPPLESIIAGVAGTDIGYDTGLHMFGLRGTWHRLWASIALGALLGASPEQEACVATIREQFEALLGRPLSAQEWGELERHALAHGSAQGEHHSE